MPRKRTQAAGPWLLIQEFPSYADAKAAQELIASLISEPILLRAKRYHPDSGNTIAEWRMTKVVRKAMGERTFGAEDVIAILLANDYHDSNTPRWLSNATKAGVLERLSPGNYRFLPATRANQLEMPCETPAPR